MGILSEDIFPIKPRHSKLGQSGSVIVEYHKGNTILRGVGIFVVVSVFMILGNGFANILVTVLFLITVIASFILIRRGLHERALILTDKGFRFQNQKTVEWKDVDDLYFTKEEIEDGTIIKLIIKTQRKKYKIDLEDLDIEMDELVSLLAHYRKRPNSIIEI